MTDEEIQILAARNVLKQIVDEQITIPVKSSVMEPSPTGDPFLPALKGDLGKILFGLVGIAAVVLPLVPSHTIFAKVLGVLVGLGGALGIASPGLRKPSA